MMKQFYSLLIIALAMAITANAQTSGLVKLYNKGEGWNWYTGTGNVLGFGWNKQNNSHTLEIAETNDYLSLINANTVPFAKVRLGLAEDAGEGISAGDWIGQQFIGSGNSNPKLGFFYKTSQTIKDTKFELTFDFKTGDVLTASQKITYNLGDLAPSASWSEFTLDLATNGDFDATADEIFFKSVIIITPKVKDNTSEALDLHMQEIYFGDYSVDIPTNLKDINSASISIYPNPVVSAATVTSLENIQGYTLYNMAGTTVKSARVNLGTSFQIEMADLERGIYMLSLQSAQGELVKKIVLQ